MKNDVIAMSGDTQNTKNGIRLGRKFDEIKCRNLPGGICVAYCGSPYLASQSFDEFLDKFQNGAVYRDLIDFFENKSKCNGNDFLICMLNPSKILTIKDGKLQKGLGTSGWIGDRDAFVKFREFESRENNFIDDDKYSTMTLFLDEMEGSKASEILNGIQFVIDSLEVESVGGFAWVISSRINSFRFSSYSQLYCDAFQNGNLIKNEFTIHVGATGENENFSRCQIPTNLGGCNMVAFYFTKGDITYAFDDGGYWSRSNCRIIKRSSISPFKFGLRPFDVSEIGWIEFVVTSVKARTELYSIDNNNEGPIFHIKVVSCNSDGIENCPASILSAPKNWKETMLLDVDSDYYSRI